MTNACRKLCFSITVLLFSISTIIAQTVTEGFETGLPTSGSSTVQDFILSSGTWTILKGASSSTKNSGALGLKLSAGSVATPTYATAPAINAVSTVSFWAKGSSGTTVSLQKSVNGGAYTEITTQAITTTFTNYTINVNETGANVRIRIANATSQTHYIDDVIITGGVATPVPAISVSTTALSSFGNIQQGATSTATAFTFSAVNLSTGVLITAPAGFVISTDNSNYGETVIVQHSGGTIATTTVYTKFSPVSATGTVTGALSISSTGASTKNVTVTGVALAAEPTTPAVISFGVIGDNSMVLNFPGGNGGNRVVVVRSGAAVSWAPTDATAISGVNTNFTSASDQGTGNKIVYNGTGTTATITGLTAGTSYHFAVYEYNAGTNNSQNYFTSGAAIVNQQTTSTTPVINISATSLSSFGNVVTGNVSGSASYTVSGVNLSAPLVITAPAGFAISTNNTSFNSTVSLSPTGGSVPATIIYARFSPASANGSVTGTITNSSTGTNTQNVTVSGIALAVQPATASTISFGTVASNSIVLNFTGGNGSNRIVLARSGSAVSWSPVDAVAVTGVNAAFGSATDQGSGNKIVYSGTGTSVTVTGLSAGTTYHFAVFEYNVGTGTSQNYLVPTTAIANKQTSSGTPVLTLTFNNSATGTFMSLPYVSGVLNDPADPAKITGIVVDVKDNGSGIPVADYTLTASSSKTSVVGNANVIITKAHGVATVKIVPSAVGYAKITLTLKKGSSSKTLAINYAVSAASSTPSSTFWHTGYSDASAAIALDNDYMVIADDEKNNLYVVDRKHSGLAVKTYYFGDLLGLTDGSTGNYKEVDIEATVRSRNVANRVFWLGSMSNAGSGNTYKPNSNTLFATTITGTGATTSFAVTGHYNSLRQQLITWGDAKGYNFTSSTASGHDAKTIDGFNVEGITIAPDNTTLYIGFRAPLVPTGNRTKALIAPLLNFESWFNNGSPSGSPTFGNPIELNLGGRGIRDIVRLSNGKYIIVAGNPLSNPLTGAIYKWTGNAGDAPVQVTDLTIAALNAEACVEIVENGQLALNKLEIISDNGSTDFYNDGTEAKDLSQDNYKKYRCDIVTTSNATALNRSLPQLVANDDEAIKVYPNPVAKGSFRIVSNVPGVKNVMIIDGKGLSHKAYSFRGGSIEINITGWVNGTYQVQVISEKGRHTRKIVILH